MCRANTRRAGTENQLGSFEAFALRALQCLCVINGFIKVAKSSQSKKGNRITVPSVPTEKKCGDQPEIKDQTGDKSPKRGVSETRSDYSRKNRLLDKIYI